MNNANIRNNLYHSLNYLLSINYTCLRISSQDTPPATSGVFSGSDVFNRSMSEKWVSRKLEDVSRMRNSMVNGVIESIGDQQENLTILNNELQKSKDYLLKIYNIWYECDKKFEEVFDGFCCLDPEFKKLIKAYETHAAFVTTEQSIAYLMDAYNNYMSMLERYSTLVAFQEITDAISKEFTNFGRPSIFYSKNNNPNLETLAINDIEEIVTNSKIPLKNIEKEIKETNKEIILLYKKYKKRKVSDDMKKEIKSSVSNLKTKLFDLNVKHNIASELIDMSKQLKLRLESASSDVKLSALNNIVEGIMDFISGVDNSRKPNKSNISVYVHKLELNYIKYLHNLLDSSFVPAKLRNLESQEKDFQ